MSCTSRNSCKRQRRIMRTFKHSRYCSRNRISTRITTTSPTIQVLASHSSSTSHNNTKVTLSKNRKKTLVSIKIYQLMVNSSKELKKSSQRIMLAHSISLKNPQSLQTIISSIRMIGRKMLISLRTSPTPHRQRSRSSPIDLPQHTSNEFERIIHDSNGSLTLTSFNINMRDWLCMFEHLLCSSKIHASIVSSYSFFKSNFFPYPKS